MTLLHAHCMRCGAPTVVDDKSQRTFDRDAKHECFASSPSAPDTRSGDAQASAVASTETVGNASQGSGGEDAALLNLERMIEPHVHDDRDVAGFVIRSATRFAEYLDTEAPDVFIEGEESFLRRACGELLIRLRARDAERHASAPTPRDFPRPYSVASPARLDGDASGRAK